MIEKEKIVPIYNTLLQIPVSGIGAIYMGDCLRALQNLLMTEEDNSGEALAKQPEGV